MAAMVIPAKRHNEKDLDYLNDADDSDSDSYSDASYSSYSDHDLSLEPTVASTATKTTTTKKVKRPKKMHPCPYPDCGKIYTQKPKLTDHILSHTGEVRMVSLALPLSFSPGSL
jgi:hypothetical protein